MFVFLTLNLLITSVFAFSRGPYLPQNEEINVSYGNVVFQNGFGDMTYYDLDFDDTFYDERTDELFYLVRGLVIVELDLGGYELGYAEYTCKVVDDGAYGSLACGSAKYRHLSIVGRYETCEYGHDYFECI